MLILSTPPPVATAVNNPVWPLNAVWLGAPRAHMVLPQWGHLLLVFPLGETAVSCSSIMIDNGRYVMLTPAPDNPSFTIDIFEPHTEQAHLLILWISPTFVADMADFLDIPDNLSQLLHGIPLLQGDPISSVLADLATACQSPIASNIAEDLFLEVVGEVLRLMRLRHQALLSLASHKDSTVADVLPRLLQARQFIEARCSQQFKTSDVADSIALSEFHFARLFKTAFDTTVRQYVIRLRLDKARRLLEQPGTAVTTTALDVGYSSLSSFIHAFTKRFGTTPAQYQARFQTQSKN